MKNRIKQIRKDHKLTQVEFGERIGVKGNTVTGYETGLRNPTDAVIKAICREFGVNEGWLRAGNGEPTIKRTKNQEIQAFANDVMELPDKDLKKRLVEGLAKLDEDDWKKILEIAEKLLSESKKEEGD